METKGLVLIFGSLALLVMSIIAGAVISGPVGHGLLAVGILGMMAWLIFVFYIASAMNTDI
jgi:hypothetical protein